MKQHQLGLLLLRNADVLSSKSGQHVLLSVAAWGTGRVVTFPSLCFCGCSFVFYPCHADIQIAVLL